MPLIPGMEFHMNNGSWPSGVPVVYMTPTYVWGPLSINFPLIVYIIYRIIEEVIN